MMNIQDSASAVLAFPNHDFLTEENIEDIYNIGMDTGSIDFSGADLSKDQPYHIADLLTSNKLISIVQIDISYVNITQDGFDAIIYACMEIKSLQSFVACGLKLLNISGMSISKLLIAKGNLRILDIKQNNLNDIGIATLSNAFSYDYSRYKYNISILTLAVLDLSYTNITDTGILALYRSLLQFLKRSKHTNIKPSLKILKLNHNCITDKGVNCIAQLLQTSNNIEHSNNIIENNLLLEELYINHNPVTSSSILSLLININNTITTPLKRLYIAQTQTIENIYVFINKFIDVFYNTINNNTTISIEYIDISIKYDYNSNNLTVSSIYAVCNSLRSLARALMCYNPTEKGLFQLNFGNLFSILYTYAYNIYKSNSSSGSNTSWSENKEVQEILTTFTELNQKTVTTVLGLILVPNVEQWIRSGEYEYKENSAVYNAAAEDKISTLESAVSTINSDTGVRTINSDSGVRTIADVETIVRTMPQEQPTQSGQIHKSSFLSSFTSKLVDNKTHNFDTILGIKPTVETLNVNKTHNFDTILGIKPTVETVVSKNNYIQVNIYYTIIILYIYVYILIYLYCCFIMIGCEYIE